MNILESGIYVEILPATSSGIPIGNFKHSYLIYRKPDGSTEVIRGGLDDKGKISVETRKSLEKSKDAITSGEKPGDRPSRKLDIPTKKLDDTWSKMRDKAESIGKEAVDYRADPIPSLPDQTSNSVVRAALDEAGIPLEKALPDGVDPDKLPGIRDNLTEKIEEAHRERDESRRERERPNPIEGEIGGTDDQNPTPPNDGPGLGDNGPSGQDDGADDDTSGEDSSGDGQNQSASLPDPGDGTGNETKDFTPEQKNLMREFDKTDGPLDNILAKDPRDLTETEFLELKKEMIDLPAGPEQDRLDAVATAFLDDKFGTDPVEVDAVGRMIDPKPIRPINKHPIPARTPDGEPLRGALNRIRKTVAGAAGGEGPANAVQGLQTGLNILRQVLGQSAGNPEARTPGIVARPQKSRRPPFSTILVPELKADGVVGPRTRQALRFATSRLGTPKIEEGFALGRFHEFAQSGRNRGFERLGDATEKSFATLFRNQARPVRRPADRVENVTLQETLNDLGRSQFGLDHFKTLKLDGAIGPRTTETFGQITNALGPERITKRFGELLGFL